MVIKEESRTYIAQVFMKDRWSDTTIKGDSLNLVQQWLKLNKDHPLISKYEQRIVERITKVMEFIVN